jgi:type IV pilus assembly protein PilN
MLVEINLLPEKEKRNKLLLIILIVVSIAFIAAMIVGYLVYESKSQTVENIEKEIEFTIALREIEEQRLVAEENIEDFNELMAKVDWISSQRISLVFLLEHLVSLLPERGYFMNYQYTDQGTVSINVQFDTPREAASYLHQLNESPFITKAALQNLTTDELTDEETSDRFRFLPRYRANYTVEINRESVKQEGKNEDEEE